MPADPENDLILVTLAAGKQGTGLIRLLAKQYRHLRLQVLSTSTQKRLQSLNPDAEVVTADLRDTSTHSGLLQGVAAAYFVHPPYYNDEHSLACNFISTCKRYHDNGDGTFKHLVYSSVLHPIIRAMKNHDSKRYTEEFLFESGLPHTILQPSHVMENFPLAKVLNEEHPVYPLPYSPDTKVTWTSTRDLAEVAAKVLNEREQHFYATYQIVSTEPGTYRQAVRWVSEATGKEVEIKRVSIEAAAERIVGGNPEQLEGCRRMLTYYDFRNLVGNRNVCRWLLGREPLSYQQWLEIKIKEIKAEQNGA